MDAILNSVMKMQKMGQSRGATNCFDDRKNFAYANSLRPSRKRSGMGIFMKKPKVKQIAAWICILLLVALYIATLVCAVADFPGWQRMFGGCLVGTVALPILLWIYIWLYDRIKQRRTPDSLDTKEP